MKNIVLFLISAFIAVFFGFFALDKKEMWFLYGNSVFYFISLIFFIWVYLIISTIIQNKKKFIDFLYSHKIAIVFSIFLVLIFFLVCPPEYRIFADETNLLGTSKSLYESGSAFFSVEEINILGEKQILQYTIDKRLIIFPYVLYVIHLIKGYSDLNAFILNAIIAFGCLFLLYYLIQKIWGKYWGYISILFLASYPLFIQYSMSAGYDVFNLFLSLLSFAVFCYFYKNNTMTNANLLMYTVALFSYTRYECSIMAIFIVPILLLMLERKEFSKINFAFIIYPLLFIPLAWIMFFANSNFHLQVNANERIFSLEYFKENIFKALYFFMNLDPDSVTVFLISMTACISILILIYKVLSNKEDIISKIKQYKYHFITLNFFFFSQIIIKFSYKLGDLTIKESFRHGIIFLPFIIVLSIYFFRFVLNKYSDYKLITTVCLVFLLIPNFVKANMNFKVRDSNTSYNVFHIVNTVLKDESKENIIIASDYPNFLTPLNYNSISIDTLNKNFPVLKSYIKEKKYLNKIIVVQIIKNEENENDAVLLNKNDFEIFYEKAIPNNSFIRFSVFK